MPPSAARKNPSLLAEAPVVQDRSRYGTFVNGERVAGSAALAAGDRLRIGTPGVVLDLVAAD